MVLSFVALIIIQVRYVKVNSEMIENQFDASVRRSLWQTVILVEENEALEYLGQTLERLDYQKNTNLRQDGRLSDIESLLVIDALRQGLTSEGRRFNKPKVRHFSRPA